MRFLSSGLPSQRMGRRRATGLTLVQCQSPRFRRPCATSSGDGGAAGRACATETGWASMRALTWQGKPDDEVRDVPDPRIPEPTDASVRILSDRQIVAEGNS